MKHFIQLTNFEVNRFFKAFLAIMVLTFIIQITGTALSAYNYMRRVNQLVKGGTSQKEVLDQLSSFGLLDIIYASYFILPILIGVTALLFYTFFIWYRDWFAKSTFIYRLLTLPTSRMNIYFAKLTTIMLLTFGLTAFQLILLVIENKIVQFIVPKVYRIDLSITQTIVHSEYLNAILPTDFIAFILYYGLGLVFTIVIFTAILFERSYKLIGSIIGALYVALMTGLMIGPFIIHYMVIGTQYLYPMEFIMLMFIVSLLIMIGSLLMSRHLMDKKVTV